MSIGLSGEHVRVAGTHEFLEVHDMLSFTSSTMCVNLPLTSYNPLPDP